MVKKETQIQIEKKIKEEIINEVMNCDCILPCKKCLKKINMIYTIN